ncbi:MAG TPA: LacI family DNA-binding transcriptional regulator [Dermatophilaceae bacterium]
MNAAGPTGSTKSTTPADGIRSTGRRVSMGDVARLAGVSAQTVSRVANGFPGVLDETRQQVLAAMTQLGYRPNSAARALKSGHFKTIGVIMFTLATTGNMRTLEAITDAALAEGYAITLLPPVPVQEHGGAFSRVGEQVVDAVIVVMEKHELALSDLVLPRGVPVVVADSGAGNQYPVVDTDQVAGTNSAVTHLLDLGHQTIWHVAGPDESFAAQRRTNAWRNGLQERGIEPPPLLSGDWSAESGYQAGLRLARESSCTAVFVANDHMALGVLRALHDSGRFVPDVVSVVGFDDVPESSSFQPPLTTVHQDFAEVGRRCIRRVLAQLRGQAPELGTDLVPTRLVVRQSTAPPQLS